MSEIAIFRQLGRRSYVRVEPDRVAIALKAPHKKDFARYATVLPLAGHIHMHVLPRWVADANFVSVIGETRILPETLEMTYERIKGVLG